jgi:hypothetical protein
MTRKFSRAAAWLALSAVFVVLAYIAQTLWQLRPQEFSLTAEPLALRDDSAALALASQAMRQVGYESHDFEADSLSYDDAFPDVRRYNFHDLARLSTHPGFHVLLVQDGTDVQVMIRRRK